MCVDGMIHCATVVLFILIISACPCHADCPMGCLGCDSWFCDNNGDQCTAPDSNPDVNEVLAFIRYLILNLQNIFSVKIALT